MAKPGLFLTHNHPPIGTDLDGCTQVKNHVDLEPAKIEKLNTLAVSAWVWYRSESPCSFIFQREITAWYFSNTWLLHLMIENLVQTGRNGLTYG